MNVTRPNVIRVVPLVLLTATVLGCSSAPTAPTGALTGQLTLSGPAEIAPGSTIPFRALLQYSDGTSEDLTRRVAWTATNPVTLSVTPSGLVSGLEAGEGTLRAAFDGMTATVPILVIPAGTFRLTVNVRDAEAGGPIFSPEVTAALDDGTVVAGKTGPRAGHTLYGVRGRIALRVSSGFFYEPSVQSIDVSGHRDLDVELTPADTGVDLSGAYILTVTASAGCTSALPEAVRVRSYAASVTQQRGGRLTVTLAGAEFVENFWGSAGTFEGRVLDAARVEFSTLLDSAAAVIEALPDPDGAYGLAGLVAATSSGDRISGAMDGEVQMLSRPDLRVVTTCRANDHAFTLIRR